MEIPIFVLLTPLIAYLVAGSLKFFLNSFRHKTLAFEHIGMGGFPSTHNTITSSTSSAIGFSLGFSTIEFLICLTVMFIVGIDSMDLRQKIAVHAERLNQLRQSEKPLRVTLGHKPHEVVGGVVLGLFIGFCTSNLS